MKRLLFDIALVIFLTVLTQVGGVVYLVSRLVLRWLKKYRKWYHFMLMFIGIYAFTSIIIVPNTAPLNGRRPLPVFGNAYLGPQNYFTVMANRHYVRSELYDLMITQSEQFASGKELKIKYLDANFPFLNGFPLIPHLSHNDGKKLDIAFRYKDKVSGEPSNNTTSLLGYGIYEGPEAGEFDQTAACKEKHWQYDITRFLGVRTDGHSLVFDEAETKRMVEQFVIPEIQKMFIEPHLKDRLNLTSDKIRFHGCHAVRHDDHLHIQIY